jgi:hypothetical protein
MEPEGSWMRIIGTWLVLALAMTFNGIFRETVLRRSMTGRGADVTSALLGIIIILGATWWLFPPLGGVPAGRLLEISAVLVALTVGFEFAVGRWVDHKSWRALAGNYAIWRGHLWPVVLATLALTPFIAAWRNARPHP